MQVIDSNQLLVINREDVCAFGKDKISSPEHFLSFTQGIVLDAEQLFLDKWQDIQLTSPQATFDFLMLEMLPSFYSYAHLAQHGEFGMTINGIGSFTIAPINGRVVVMTGAPVDYRTYEEVIDFAVDPDIFLAFCRGLMLNA